MKRKKAKPRKKKRSNKFGAHSVGKYRSKLEKYCAEQLEWFKIPYEYENLSVQLIDKFSYPFSYEKWGKTYKQVKTVRGTKYIPDFVGDTWIIETKGVRTASFNIKWKLFKRYILDNNLNYTLYAPSNKKEVDTTIKMILNESSNASSGTGVPRLPSNQFNSPQDNQIEPVLN